MSELKRAFADLSLFAGIFLVLLGIGTFGWLSILYGGGYALINVGYALVNITFIDNAVIIGGLALICESLLLMQFGFKTGIRKPPSKNLLIDFAFVIGSFLFFSGVAIDNSVFGGVSLPQLDTGYAYMFLGLALFALSLFAWDRRRRSEIKSPSLRWEIISSFSVAVILFVFFIASNGSVSIPIQMSSDGPVIAALLFTAWLIAGLYKVFSVRKLSTEEPQTYLPAAASPAIKYLTRSRSTYLIIAVVAVLILLFIPIIPVTLYCNHGIYTGISIAANYNGLRAC